MITGHVRGQELKLDRTTIAADSIKYLEAEFHFAGRDWDGYVKTAYFINGASKFALVLADDRITADMGLNLTVGEWEVKLSGVKGDSRITTTTESIYVREFGGTEGTLPDVTPTQAEQLLAKIGDMSALETEAKDSLVAAINEAAKSGGGSGGKDGTGIESITYKGEDEYGGNMYTVLLTDGTSYEITAPKGAAGAAGITPHIGDNGNWYLGTTDTGKPSRGDKGEDAAADLTLGLTGATVGQIAKIAAVDESGVPTAWSPVDMPSGGGGETWETIDIITLSNAVNTVTINQDSGGNAIALKKLRILIEGSATQAQDLFLNNSRYFRAAVVGTSASVGALSAEPFCGKMYCFAVPNIIANYAVISQQAAAFSTEITITEIKLIVNNSGTYSVGTKFTIQGVRA